MEVRHLPGDPAAAARFAWRDLAAPAAARGRRPRTTTAAVLLLAVLGTALVFLARRDAPGAGRPDPDLGAGWAGRYDGFRLAFAGCRNARLEAALRALILACRTRPGPEADAALFCALYLWRRKWALPRGPIAPALDGLPAAGFPATAKLVAALED